MKESFIIHTNDWKMVQKLTVEQRGVLFTALMCFQTGEGLPEMDAVTDMAFGFMSSQLERDNKKYADIVDARTAAGKKGAEARWGDGKNGKDSNCHHSQNGKNGKHALSVSVSESVSVSDTVSVSESESQGMSDSDTHTHDDSFYGKLKNVELTPEQYEEIVSTYQTPKKLIDKVSVWLPDHPKAKNHYALVLKFAMNDNWPKKPIEPEKPPDEQDQAEYVPAPDEVKKKMRDMFS